MRIKNNVAVSASGLIFNPDTGESFTVNPMGAMIINELKEGKSQEEIIATTIEKYFVEKNTFEKDFEDFLGLLHNFSLVEND
ncbi:MAG TPA: PqqD family protein [Bacteroidales bacterium]|nr:PqqD family protein [Bacteroidales bacterium]HPR58397.1 PqqD family protein [Bacteroidales bacterium]HRW96353.1 PqqD family protein [Bacteroidales bacterium]